MESQGHQNNKKKNRKSWMVEAQWFKHCRVAVFKTSVDWNRASETAKS